MSSELFLMQYKLRTITVYYWEKFYFRYCNIKFSVCKASQ